MVILAHACFSLLQDSNITKPPSLSFPLNVTMHRQHKYCNYTCKLIICTDKQLHAVT